MQHTPLWKRLFIWGICLFGLLWATPNVFYTRVEQHNDAAKAIEAAGFATPEQEAALAGWLLAIRTSGATANLGTGMLFNAFAAVVIGGVSLKGGVGALPGVYAGVLLLSSINTAINLMGLPAHYTQVIHGLLVLAAVLLDTLKQTIRKKLA